MLRTKLAFPDLAATCIAPGWDGRCERKVGHAVRLDIARERERERIYELPFRCEVSCAGPRSSCVDDIAADCLTVARELARGIRALSENKY